MCGIKARLTTLQSCDWFKTGLMQTNIWGWWSFTQRWQSFFFFLQIVRQIYSVLSRCHHLCTLSERRSLVRMESWFWACSLHSSTSRRCRVGLMGDTMSSWTLVCAQVLCHGGTGMGWWRKVKKNHSTQRHLYTLDFCSSSLRKTCIWVGSSGEIWNARIPH